MTDTRLADTVGTLAASLRPVRRLPKPALQALVWLAAVVAVTAILYVALGGEAVAMAAPPWVLPGFIGSVLTAALAAVAAFQLSRPDRADAWVLAPVAPAILWLVAIVAGCVAGADGPDVWGSRWFEARQCLFVIAGTAIPLSALVILMLRWARPQRWLRVALLAGLASAAAAGSVLIFVHPHNTGLLDLAVHTVCIAAVVSLTAAIGGRVLKHS